MEKKQYGGGTFLLVAIPSIAFGVWQSSVAGAIWMFFLILLYDALVDALERR